MIPKVVRNNMLTIIAKLAKQRNTSPRIGALMNAYSSTAIIYAPLTLIGVATTVYGLWGGDIIRQWIPWFTLPMLVGCLVLFVIAMMVFFYKVIIPSQVAFSVQQSYKHRNPIVTDVHNILRNQDNILSEIRNIKDRLDKLDVGKGGDG